MVAVATGRLADAEHLVAHGLATGPPLGHYEARLHEHSASRLALLLHLLAR
jgi:hypothetical protein